MVDSSILSKNFGSAEQQLEEINKALRNTGITDFSSTGLSKLRDFI